MPLPTPLPVLLLALASSASCWRATTRVRARIKMVSAPRIERLSPPSSTAPVLLYLPNVDLAGGASLRGQMDDLGRDFDVRALVASAEDRTTTVEDLAALVATAVDEEPKATYLLGDSFGAVVALAAALRKPRPPPGLGGLVLINPATSVELSWLPTLAPALDALARAPTAARAPLLPLVPLCAAAATVGDSPLALRRVPASQARELASLAASLPPATLQARLASLRAAAVELTLPRKLARLTLPVHLLCSTEDRLLPSADEGRRLARDLPNARLRLLRGAGHAACLDERVRLGPLLRASRLTERKPQARVDYVSAFETPSAEAIANASASLATLRRLASPVYLSTTAEGHRVVGLDPLRSLLPVDDGAPSRSGGPSAPNPRRPVLLVGNHQLIGPDISMLVAEIHARTGRLVRGLSHPSNFRVAGTESDEANEGGAEGGGDGFANFNAKFGAVPVSARALARLMQRGEAALLYPGGLREAFKSTTGRAGKPNEAYTLMWPPSADGGFARIAARYNATIVPVAAVGADEAFEMLLDADDVLRTPLLGERAAETARRTPIALPGERFVTPVSLPAPWKFRRFYFALGAPIPTEQVNATDRAACAALQQSVKAEVEAQLDYLLERRSHDPYEPLLPRLAVEASWNWTRQVPSFTI